MGLLTASFVPPPPIRVLRDRTRSRKTLVALRTQEINRIHQVLDTAKLKLGVVASTVVGVSGRRRLRASEQGESDPEVVAELAKGQRRAPLPALRLALTGRVQPHRRQPHRRQPHRRQPHRRQLLGELLDHLVYLEQAAHRVEVRIADLLAAQERAIQLLLTVPATGPVTAAAILAEIGTDMARFARAPHLASWAGGCPGNKRSAGRHLSGTTTTGNTQLKTIRCEIAATIARSPGTYLHAC
jgi:transposase